MCCGVECRFLRVFRTSIVVPGQEVTLLPMRCVAHLAAARPVAHYLIYMMHMFHLR